MNTDLTRVLKAIAGIVVLFILLTVVYGWWKDYRAASPEEKPPGSSTATSTPDATGTAGSAAATPAAGAKTIVVLIDGLNLRETPDTGGKRILSLKKGDRVTLIKSEASWHQVRTADKKVGWMSANPQYSKIEE